MHRLEDFVKDPSVYKGSGEVRIHSYVESKNNRYPLASIHYGNPNSPTLLLIGGVHGLERIGAQLTLSFLDSFHQRLAWDEPLKEMLSKIQVVFVPLVNPIGYFEGTRSNGNGVDLNRNAPVTAEKAAYLVGGQDYSPRLPWYRGTALQQENRFLIETVKSVLEKSNCVISLDSHSGFGFRDQLWFPFANSAEVFPQISEIYLLFELFKKTHPYHIYKIEAQSKNYMTHGDLWDYCYLNLKKENQIFLPLTLEMGSWLWVRKNPLQLFSKSGLFNPVKDHRLNRTLRRHRPLFDFLMHSLISNSVWTHKDFARKEAVRTYYGKN